MYYYLAAAHTLNMTVVIPANQKLEIVYGTKTDFTLMMLPKLC